MRVLLDADVPAALLYRLPGHEVTTAQRMGWGLLKNGELLLAAETQGFDVLLTGDKNLSYQQILLGVDLHSSCWVRRSGSNYGKTPRQLRLLWTGHRLAASRCCLRPHSGKRVPHPAEPRRIPFPKPTRVCQHQPKTNPRDPFPKRCKIRS